MTVKLHCAAEDCGQEVGPAVPRVIAGMKTYHLACYMEPRLEEAREAGRQSVIEEMEAAKQRLIEATEAQARSEFEALPRCTRCGTKMFSDTVKVTWAKFGTVNAGSSVRGVCGPCVRSEVQARTAARGAPPPAPPVVPPAPQQPKEEPKDRFQLIDIE